MLESIREIFNTAHIEFEFVDIDYKDIFGSSDMISCIKIDKKTPVVNICKYEWCQTTHQWQMQYGHAMVATEIETEIIGGEEKQFLRCKNSFRDDPNKPGTFRIFWVV